MHPDTFLFDLDGTLVDSVPDLTASINLLRDELGCPPLDEAQVRGYIGDGVGLLVQRAVPKAVFAPSLRDRFMQIYAAHLTDQTFVYPGISAFLEAHRHSAMAVVTNKPQGLAEEIVERLGLTAYFRTVIGAEGPWRRKPEPDMLLAALDRLDRDASRAVLLGDHHVDLRAARAAGTASCFCAWGFGHADGLVADFHVRTPADLKRVFAGERV